METPFWDEFLGVLGLADDPDFAHQHDEAMWPTMKARLAGMFRSRTRAQWEEAFPAGRACVSPVLSMTEAVANEHNAARGTFTQNPAGGYWPAPAPRFSRTPCGEPMPVPSTGEDTVAVLTEAGLSRAEIDDLMGVTR